MSTRARRLALGLPAAAALLLYLRTLGYEFVYDDEPLIQTHTFLHDISAVWKGFAHAFWETVGEQRTERGYYRPLGTAVFALLWQLGGGSAGAFHGANVLLHAAASFLVARLALRLGWSAWAAGAAGLLFAAHGAHVEPVAWISGMPYLLAAVFGLLALTSLAQGRVRSCALFLLPAVLSHEAGFGVALLALLAFLLKPEGPRRRGLLLLAPVAAVLLLRMWVFEGIGAGFDTPNRMYEHLEGRFDYDAGDRLALALSLVLRYTAFLLWPAPHAHFRPLRVDQQAEELLPEALGGAAILVIGAAVWAWRGRRSSLVLLPAGLLIAGLLPVLNVQGIGTFPFEERFTYLPSVGFALLVAGLLIGTRERPATARVRIGAGLALLASALHGANAAATTPVWRDNPRFFAWATEQSPNSVSAWVYHGNELVRKAQELPEGSPERARLVDEVFRVFEHTTGIDRRRYYVTGLENEQRHALQGNALLLEEDLRSAEVYWDRVLQESPGEPNALAGLAQTLAMRGDRAMAAGRHEDAKSLYEEALDLYERAWRSNEELSAALHGHGLCLLRLARVEEALPLLRRAHEASPRNFAFASTLARALSEAGQPTEAITRAEEIVDREPERPEAWLLLAQVLHRFAEQQGERTPEDVQIADAFRRARDAYRRALELGSQDPLAHFGLGWCYLVLGRRADAERELRRAFSLEPSNMKLMEGLGTFYSLEGRLGRALAVVEQFLAAVPAGHPQRAQAEKLHEDLLRLIEQARAGQGAGTPPDPPGASDGD